MANKDDKEKVYAYFSAPASLLETEYLAAAAGLISSAVAFIWHFFGYIVVVAVVIAIPVIGVSFLTFGLKILRYTFTGWRWAPDVTTSQKWLYTASGLIRVSVFLLVLFLSMSFVVQIVLPSLGMKVDPKIRLIEPSLQTFSLGVGELVAISVVIALFWCLLEGRSWIELGLGFQQPWKLHIFVGTVVAIILTTVIFLTGVAAQWVEVVGREAAHLPRIISTAALLFIFASAEELLFRGYLLQSLERSSGTTVAVAVSSFLYALFHLGNPDASLLAFIAILVHGIFLCAALLLTRSLWLPIGFHWMWNMSLGVIFGLPVSGYNFERILQSKLLGMNFLYSPGGFGPEAGLLSILCLIVGVGLLGRILIKMQLSGPSN